MSEAGWVGGWKEWPGRASRDGTASSSGPGSGCACTPGLWTTRILYLCSVKTEKKGQRAREGGGDRWERHYWSAIGRLRAHHKHSAAPAKSPSPDLVPDSYLPNHLCTQSHIPEKITLGGMRINTSSMPPRSIFSCLSARDERKKKKESGGFFFWLGHRKTL